MVELVLIYILLSTVGIALTAWIGVVVLFLSDDLLNKLFMPLIAFSAGLILGAAFFHFIPEVLETDKSTTIVFICVSLGFCLFFIGEQIFNWQKAKHQIRTDHYMGEDDTEEHQPKKSAVFYLILIAGGIHNIIGGIHNIIGGIHNIIGGMAIGTSFLISKEVGLITTIAALGHHLP